jgi:hypothetical protein
MRPSIPDGPRHINRTGMNKQHSNRDVSREINQTHTQVINHLGEPWCADQRHDPGRRQLGDGTLKDSDIGVAVQARWIDDAVWKRLMLVESPRRGRARL